MEKKLQKSTVPIYAVGITWMAYALLFPLYRTAHYIAAAILSAAVYFVANKIFKPKEVLVEKALIGKTGNERVDNLLEEANGYIIELRKYKKTINNLSVSAKVLSIEEITMKILNYIVDHPDDISNVRRFINYYLPTTNKLLNSYVDLESQNASTPNIAGTMQKIDDMLETVIEAFNKQHDSLYEYKAMDIGAEIHVMEDILTSEGLLENEATPDISSSNAVADFEKAQSEAGISLTLEPDIEKVK